MAASPQLYGAWPKQNPNGNLYGFIFEWLQCLLVTMCVCQLQVEIVVHHFFNARKYIKTTGLNNKNRIISTYTNNIRMICVPLNWWQVHSEFDAILQNKTKPNQNLTQWPIYSLQMWERSHHNNFIMHCIPWILHSLFLHIRFCLQPPLCSNKKKKKKRVKKEAKMSNSHAIEMK